MAPAKQTIEELQAEIARLSAALSESDSKLSDAEKMAHAMAAASRFMVNYSGEQATGKTVTLNVCLNPDCRDKTKLKWKEVEYPTYFYAIQLPAGAGISLTTNGVEYYHGETYEFDSITLAEMKSRVARCWDHEKSIHGDNENAYRKPTNIFVG